MRTLLPVAVITVMAILSGRAAALMLEDGLLGAMAGLLLFLPMIVMTAPFLERRPVPARIVSRSRERGIQG